LNEDSARPVLTGLPASAGLAVGRICFWNDPEGVPRYAITADMIAAEMKRLDEALELSRNQLAELRRRVERELSAEEAAIFSSHKLLLEDPSFYERVQKRLTAEKLNLEAVVADVIEEVVQLFKRIPDPYLRERADDYRDVGRRVLENLVAHQRECAREEGEQIVLVARELLPSDTLHFQREHIAAFVTERGGVSSHAAILARSLRLPAVVGVDGVLNRLRAGERVLVDGSMGKIMTAPTPEEIARAARDRQASEEKTHRRRLARPVTTKDKVPIQLSANLTREDEAEDAHHLGAMGVGLLRTEFLFMDRGEFLDEDSQYQAYKRVVEIMLPHPVTIRTLDLGEDKLLDFKNPMPLERPVLGWRSLRLTLAMPEMFLVQLRAILRAAAYGPARILLPMVTGPEDIRAVRRLLAQAAEDLQSRGIPFRQGIPVGAMIETPAAAILPGVILAEADFLSVGTNDLVQYTLVADRASERTQAYYRPTSPAVLSLLNRLVRAAASAGKDLAICGEIAGDPLYLPLLLGLGYRNLSAAPVLIPDLADAVERLSILACEELTRRCQQLSTADEVEELLHAYQKGQA
jgi:phosphoenolpyruvate-protein phosphotransferase (PTS system enzyme I)